MADFGHVFWLALALVVPALLLISFWLVATWASKGGASLRGLEENSGGEGDYSSELGVFDWQEAVWRYCYCWSTFFEDLSK